MNKESRPIVDVPKPARANRLLTASTAGLAHAGTLFSSNEPNKFSICEDIKASLGNAAIAALTSTGWLSNWASTFSGSSTIAAVIAGGRSPTSASISEAAPTAASPLTARVVVMS